jgi:hypothetical protein
MTPEEIIEIFIDNGDLDRLKMFIYDYGQSQYSAGKIDGVLEEKLKNSE